MAIDMSLTTLKWLRFVTSGAIILCGFFIFGKITKIFDINIPTDAGDYPKMISVLLFGSIYYVTPLRDWANKRYHRRVSENIRLKMIEIAGLEDKNQYLTWKAVRGVFFFLIDNDKSLKEKSSIAYFDGYMWTTIADIRAVSVSFAFISVIVWFFGVNSSLIAVTIFAFIAVISHVASNFVTKNHIKIGNEQLEIIELYYKEDVYKKLRNVRV